MPKTIPVYVGMLLEVDPESWDLTYGTGTSRKAVEDNVRAYFVQECQGHRLAEEGTVVSVTADHTGAAGRDKLQPTRRSGASVRKADRERLAAEEAEEAERKLKRGREALLQIAARIEELGYLRFEDDEPRVMVPAQLLNNIAEALDAVKTDIDTQEA